MNSPDPYEDAPDAGQGVEGIEHRIPLEGNELLTDSSTPAPAVVPPEWWAGETPEAYVDDQGRATLVWIRQVDDALSVDIRVEDIWIGRAFVRQDPRVWFLAEDAAHDGLGAADLQPLCDAFARAAGILAGGAQ